MSDSEDRVPPWTYVALVDEVGWDPANDYCCGDVETGHEWDCWRGPVWDDPTSSDRRVVTKNTPPGA